VSYLTSDYGARWTAGSTLPAEDYLGATSFAWTGRSWAGWLVHDWLRGQQVEITTNGGATVTPLNSPVVSNVQLLSARSGYAWTTRPQGSSPLYFSSDSGRHWVRRNLPVSPTLLAFIDPQHAWLVANSTTWQTADGGRTWHQR
jgi:photosystem II stability/assembly factor-like uncharacterized protein